MAKGNKRSRLRAGVGTARADAPRRRLATGRRAYTEPNGGWRYGQSKAGVCDGGFVHRLRHGQRRETALVALHRRTHAETRRDVALQGMSVGIPRQPGDYREILTSRLLPVITHEDKTIRA